MTFQNDDELLRSLKEIFTSGLYSDLKISCGDNHHRVHRAIVLPRSPLLASLCEEIHTDIDQHGIVIPDEDPQAVEMMLHYLYTLDYPKVLAKQQESGFINGSVTNGNHAEDVKQIAGHPTTPILEYSIEQEQFEPVPPSENGAEQPIKKKGKKKKKSVVSPSPQVSSNLVVHAKIYALASKFCIQGLKILSAEKFKTEVESCWDSDDFLSAAQQVYTSTDAQDRTMRDAVLSVLKQHTELLDRKQVQDVIKGLELSFDLLMHLRGA
ncbi:hypothetical protein BJ170DRAFT_620108 [Xylariales sp. AK1849]|nr:hypothetical protein BJ170DRAFT_620108 [Xylariales sp. AK1849]